jgi:hypothetical protein
MDEFSDYLSVQQQNQAVFRHNFSADIATFRAYLTNLRSIWARLGSERGTSGQSQAGLLPLSNILIRHVMFGFEHLASYQSFLAWLTFRPGLEALLIIGKFVDDPATARIWLERELNASAYRQTFEGRALESSALSRSSSEFRQVLGRLNSEFMHPNPKFMYRDTTARADEEGMLIEIQFFDQTSDIHEAHLLAYLNLLDLIVQASESLANNLCGPATAIRGEAYSSRERIRATHLAARSDLANKIMQELGLWKF